MLSVFPRHNLKHCKAFPRLVKSTNISEMDKNLPNFDLGLGYLFPPEPEEKKQKKEEPQRFACLNDRELDVHEICHKIRSKRFSR